MSELLSLFRLLWKNFVCSSFFFFISWSPLHFAFFLNRGKKKTLIHIFQRSERTKTEWIFLRNRRLHKVYEGKTKNTLRVFDGVKQFDHTSLLWQWTYWNIPKKILHAPRGFFSILGQWNDSHLEASRVADNEVLEH